MNNNNVKREMEASEHSIFISGKRVLNWNLLLICIYLLSGSNISFDFSICLPMFATLAILYVFSYEFLFNNAAWSPIRATRLSEHSLPAFEYIASS